MSVYVIATMGLSFVGWFVVGWLANFKRKRVKAAEEAIIEMVREALQPTVFHNREIIWKEFETEKIATLYLEAFFDKSFGEEVERKVLVQWSNEKLAGVKKVRGLQNLFARKKVKDMKRADGKRILYLIITVELP